MSVETDNKSGISKIGFCAAFEQGYDTLSFAVEQQNHINFVATCSKDDSEYQQKINDLCEEKKIKVFKRIDGNEENFISFLIDENIDIVILLWWPSIIKLNSIKSVKIGWVNLHPSLLPYGRGKHGYFWSIVEDTPFGVSIHFINDGIDTGPVLFQKEIKLSFSDTGHTLYQKGVDEVIKLFKSKYSDIVSLNFSPVIQDNKNATSHFAIEIEDKTKIDLNKKYKALDLINLIRARTFWDGPSLKLNKNGFDYYLRMKIEKVKKD
jgi:methionyl-tRNA formyltransferase